MPMESLKALVKRGAVLFKIMYNDLFNSKIFIELHKDNLKYCDSLGGFFEYNGQYWEKVSTGVMKKYSFQVIDKLIDLSKDMDDKYKELMNKHIKASGNAGKLDSMIDCAKPSLYMPSERFDSNQNLFNCSNETFNLDTCQSQRFNPNDFITKSCNIDHDDFANCPTWIKFINDIFLNREDIIDFVQRFVGYSMTTSTKEQCMFILHGDGRNGKTVFIETIRKIFGDYVTSLPSTSLVRKPIENGIPNDIAGLKGARLVTTVETNENATLDESMIKKITGSDIIKARFLNKEFFEFMPTFKLIYASNHKPNIRGTDNGIWRRIRMIPFDFKITDENDDKCLQQKLDNELPGILNWAIEGYKKWRESGLTKPPVIMETTEQYREEEDSLGQFIEEECDIDKESYVTVKDFKSRVTQFNKYLNQKSIGEYMRKKGYMPKDNRLIVDGKQTRCFIGISLKSNGYHKQEQNTWGD